MVQIGWLQNSVSNWMVTHTLREANREANELARQVLLVKVTYFNWLV